jgi:predicted Zn-dependent protease
MRADGWSRMPLVRMTNLHLEPGEGTLDDLLADVDDGIYLETNKSWSIDDKRLNFQFGTQIAWEIKNGKLGRMLRDATYTGITPVSSGARSTRRRADEWRLYGLTNCGKGQPGQHAHVSHGARRRASGTSRSAWRRRDARSRSPSARSRRRRGRTRPRRRPGERSGLARFAARGAPADADRERSRRDAARRRDGNRVGVAPTNRSTTTGSASSPRARPTRRRRAPRGSRLPRLARPRELPAVDGYDEETAALGPADQARLAAAAIDAAGDFPVYGFFTSGVDRARRRVLAGVAASSALTDATGARARRRRRRLRATPSDGWASGDVDPARRRARGRREGGADARRGRVEPGTYRAVLEPYAIAELLQYFAYDSFGALALLEERSYFAGRIGERVFDEKVSIADDALDPRGLPKAFDFEGTPKQRVPLVEDGVARGVVWDRATAKRAGGGQETTGHAPPPDAALGAAPVRALDRARRRRVVDELVERSATASTSRASTTSASSTRARRDHRDDARRDLPDPRRQDRRAARQPALHRVGPGAARGRARPDARDERS